MRLDKFLKVSRLIKRRPLAKEMADKGRVSLNGRQAKAGANVKVGDELTIRFGRNLVTVQVKELKESTRKEDAEKMYQLIKEERLSEDSE